MARGQTRPIAWGSPVSPSQQMMHHIDPLRGLRRSARAASHNFADSPVVGPTHIPMTCLTPSVSMPTARYTGRLPTTPGANPSPVPSSSKVWAIDHPVEAVDALLPERGRRHVRRTPTPTAAFSSWAGRSQRARTFRNTSRGRSSLLITRGITGDGVVVVPERTATGNGGRMRSSPSLCRMSSG